MKLLRIGWPALMLASLTGISLDASRHETIGMLSHIFCAVGIAMNVLVIWANGWKMPVYPERISPSDNHVDFSEVTRFPWLCDRFGVEGRFKASIGDIALTLAVLLIPFIRY